MIDDSKAFIRFTIILLCFASTAMVIQSHLSGMPIIGSLGGTYILNSSTAAAIFLLIIRLRQKYSEQLGFVFLAGSGFKFLLFFLLIYPVFHADGALSREEFSTFFIPYSITTAIETIALARILNKS
jgi:F0F1-type ATP synthase assembly protein I